MPYVRRNAAGRIVATSCEPAAEFDEQLSESSPELQTFLTRMSDGAEPARELAGTDLSFIRVLEDLIELLITRNVIRFTDLPAPAQEKMLERQQLRDAMQPHLDLLDDEREDPLF